MGIRLSISIWIEAQTKDGHDGYMTDNKKDTSLIPTSEQKLDQQLALLARMSQEFTTSLDLEETLNHAIAQMMDYMNAEAASIFLLDNNDSELVCRACAGPIELIGLRLAADHGIIGNTVKQNQVQMVLLVQMVNLDKVV